ncbi:MAG: hypothetical protein WA198_10490 [Candidatus Sulfotelmatobacter sp.]
MRPARLADREAECREKALDIFEPAIRPVPENLVVQSLDALRLDQPHDPMVLYVVLPSQYYIWYYGEMIVQRAALQGGPLPRQQLSPSQIGAMARKHRAFRRCAP